MMRGRVLIFLLVNLCVVAFLLNSIWTLVSLLYVDGSDDEITKAELPSPNSEKSDSRPQIIPKIIHQTYKNETIPEVWREAQQSCIDLHSDYEYKLWTDAAAREFIAKEYEWFLETWDAYPFNIERADAIRYFILHHYGGVYIDLDDGCKRRLDPLLSYPAVVRRTKPTGISNDVMAAVPGHPFFLRVINSLETYNRNWIAPYITIMSSTGPLFLSLIWRHHNTAYDDMPDSARVRILFPNAYMGHKWSFFSHHVGNSWHKWDTNAIIWMGQHWIELFFIGAVLVIGAFALCWYAYQRCFLSRQRRSYWPRFLTRRLPAPYDWFELADQEDGPKLQRQE